MFYKKLIFREIAFFFLMLFAYQLQAQQRPIGRFVPERVELGQPVSYVLTYEHAPDEEVIFADSTFDFKPFELRTRVFFPTKTINGISKDSVVYQLVSYEVQSSQKLVVPIFVLNAAGEQVPIYPDSVVLTVDNLVAPDSLLRADITPLPVVTGLWHFYTLLTLGILLVLALILLLIFGKKIRKKLLMRKLHKQHLKFIEDFDRIIYGLGQGQVLEHGLARWKVYTGTLVGMPFQSFTTKEIMNIVQNEQLNDALKSIDRVIYAGLVSDDLNEKLVYLKAYTQAVYEKKVEELKRNGKS